MVLRWVAGGQILAALEVVMQQRSTHALLVSCDAPVHVGLCAGGMFAAQSPVACSRVAGWMGAPLVAGHAGAGDAASEPALSPVKQRIQTPVMHVYITHDNFVSYNKFLQMLILTILRNVKTVINSKGEKT